MKKLLSLAVLAAALAFTTTALANEAVELKDGTKVEIKGEDVFVIGADGKATPAPDGTHEAKDGHKITTKGGKLVK